jgi:hypothetical protein
MALYIHASAKALASPVVVLYADAGVRATMHDVTER